MAAARIELLALGDIDPDTARTSGYRLVGTWRLGDTAGRDALLAGIAASGWYDAFVHVNAATVGDGRADHPAGLAAA